MKLGLSNHDKSVSRVSIFWHFHLIIKNWIFVLNISKTGKQASSCVSGSYLHIETSGVDVNASALYRSSLYQFSTASCLFRFAYHMIGTNIGTLEVRAVNSTGDVLYQWQRVGQQSDRWILGGLPLPSIKSSFRIEIQATHTSGFQGDIAIDDLEFINCDPGIYVCLLSVHLSVNTYI